MDGARAIGAAPSGGAPPTEGSRRSLPHHRETNGDIGGGSGEKTAEGEVETGRLRILNSMTVPPSTSPRETAKMTRLPSALLSVEA